MGSVASIDLYYADREAKRFDDDFGVEDIAAYMLEHEDIKIDGHYASCGEAFQEVEQARYELDMAIAQGAMPTEEEIEAYRKVLLGAIKERAEKLGVWVL